MRKCVCVCVCVCAEMKLVFWKNPTAHSHIHSGTNTYCKHIHAHVSTCVLTYYITLFQQRSLTFLCADSSSRSSCHSHLLTPLGGFTLSICTEARFCFALLCQLSFFFPLVYCKKKKKQPTELVFGCYCSPFRNTRRTPW